MSTHAAMVDRVDQNIGRILTKLKELNKLDNTIVLFMSDNGAQSQDSPDSWLWDKGKHSDNSMTSIEKKLKESFQAGLDTAPYHYFKQSIEYKK